MPKLWIVIKNILKRIFRKPSSYLLHIILPVAAAVGMFFAFSSETSSKIAMAVSDMDNTKASQAVMESIEQTGKFNIIETDVDNANHMVAEGEVSFGYVIPTGFEDTVLKGASPTVKITAMGQNEGTAWIRDISDYQIQNIMDLAVGAEYDKDMLHQMIDDIKDGAVKMNTVTTEDFTSKKDVASSALGMYIMVLMISTFTIAFMLLNEKQLGTLARISMAPVNTKIYTLANVFANLMVAAVQIALVLAILTGVLKMNFFMSPVMLFLIMFCFAICAVSLGLMLAAFAKKTEVAGSLLSLVLTPSCMLAGCFWPIEFMPEYLKKAAYITPQRWTLDAISGMQSGLTMREVAPNLVIVLSFALLFFMIAAYRFNREDKQLG